MKCAQIRDEDVSQFRTFLKHFAFYIFINSLEGLSEEEFNAFYDDYNRRFMIVGYETCKSVLLDSGLLICEDDYFYKFGYKYVYYFTVAEYISGIVNQKEGKMIIQSLCNTIESEEVSNILIFLTYHIFQHLSPFGKGRKQTLAFRPSRPISGILGKWLNNFILLLSSTNTFKCSILC